MANLFSIGVDIVDVWRVARLIKNKRFLEKVYSPVEVDYCRLKPHPAQHYAVRFAAKEAVYKALQKPGLGHRDICVENAPSGQPRVRLKKSLRHLEGRISLSLSHTRDQAVAMAVFQK